MKRIHLEPDPVIEVYKPTAEGLKPLSAICRPYGTKTVAGVLGNNSLPASLADARAQRGVLTPRRIAKARSEQAWLRPSGPR